MAFEMTQKVLFRHCDPAGIVFFPRYFEMMNDCVEAFFAEAPFEELHRTAAVPTAQIETRFAAPSRHGDTLTLRLAIRAVGRSSARYDMQGLHVGALRFETVATLVHIDTQGWPEPWPDPIRSRLLEACEDEP